LYFEDKKLILFDLDGTLIDSAPDLARALNTMMLELGSATHELESITQWIGNGAQMLVKRALLGRRDVEEASVDQALFEKAMKLFMHYYRDYPAEKTYPYAGVLQALDVLQERGYTLAIVTNKPYVFIAPILQKLAMAQHFIYTVGGDSLPLKKPDPSPLLHACEYLDTPVAQSVMVGDTSNDMLAARAAGMDSIAVSYGYSYGEDIRSYRPNTVIAHFSEILDLF